MALVALTKRELVLLTRSPLLVLMRWITVGRHFACLNATWHDVAHDVVALLLRGHRIRASLHCAQTLGIALITSLVWWFVPPNTLDNGVVVAGLLFFSVVREYVERLEQKLFIANGG